MFSLLPFHQVLDKKSEEFEMLDKYVANTHAPTHSHYQLEVQEVSCKKFVKIKSDILSTMNPNLGG